MKLVTIKNFMFDAEYFHSANVAKVPGVGQDGKPTGESRVMLQLFLWVPESSGSNTLRQVNIAEDTIEGTVTLYVHVMNMLSNEPYSDKERESLITELTQELSGEAARNGTGPNTQEQPDA